MSEQNPEELIDGGESVDIDAQPPIQTTSVKQEDGVDQPDAGDVVEFSENYHYEDGLAWTTVGAPKPTTTKETLALPSLNNTALQETLLESSISPGSITDSNKAHIQIIGEASRYLPVANSAELTASREGSDWRQYLKSETGQLRAGFPSIKPQIGSYNAEAARNVIRAHLKLGTPFQLPLWHSGFWVTFSSPSEVAILDLYRQIADDKVNIGRATFGQSFSNAMVYTNKRLVEFALSHVMSSTLNVPNEELIKHIRLPDLNLLIWGITCAIWPSGFQYRRPCTAEPTSCNHVVHEKINLARINAVDNTQFTPWQVAHMSKRSAAGMTLETVQRYVSEFTIGQNRVVKIKNVSFELTMPTIENNLLDGMAWIDSIENDYAEALTTDLTQREQHLMDRSKATAMRQFTHFVSKIILSDELSFSEKEIIQTTLDDLSQDDVIRTTFEKEITKFVDDSLVSFLGIPAYKCPGCGQRQPIPKRMKQYDLIPIDAGQSFLSLTGQRVGFIQQRKLTPTLLN
jgi:hypothetical protein